MAIARLRRTVLPDIFITGVMKGGTTILFDYICTHPRINGGLQKEIHYFSLHYDEGPEWYADHFRDMPRGCRTIDASPTYFDVTNTMQIPRLLKAAAADPRIIIITRDPIERAISHFVHLQETTEVESLQGVCIDDFFASDLVEAFGQNTALGFYLNMVLGFSFYFRKFITYRQALDPPQLLVLDNRNLREDADGSMRRVFDFLDVEYVSNELFGQVRHSNGSSVDRVSQATFDRLAGMLYPDYRKFCQHAGLEFQEIARAA